MDSTMHKINTIRNNKNSKSGKDCHYADLGETLIEHERAIHKLSTEISTVKVMADNKQCAATIVQKMTRNMAARREEINTILDAIRQHSAHRV
ncbi:hypothetical protein EB796_007298 [Bugula neritina]|uniref:Uncharacterized protein n=1 Tax=Bugula neritina TaxID=10212 RepID=A0A7J7K6Y2_BUGNE|nr:hypothetical protein EB796_007298 [Bugula neritina]